MSKLLPIANVAQHGMITDVDPWMLPVNAFTHARNVRSVADNVSPQGGYKDWKTLPDTPNLIVPFETPRGTAIIIIDNIIDKITYIYTENDTPIDITGDFKFTGTKKFSYAAIDDTFILCGGDVPYYITKDLLTGFKSLPWDSAYTWADLGHSTNVIARHGQYLFALDVTMPTGEEIPDAVRWSSPADVDNLPETWDELDTTAYAGFVHLAGSGGKCIAGLSLKNSFVVYRERGVHVFDYVGGSYVWQIRQVTDGKGALSPRSVVEVNGIHYLMARDDIYTFDGRTFTPLTLNKVKETYVKCLDPDLYDLCYAVKNQFHNEIMFCMAEEGHTQPNMALVYNYAIGSWSYKRFRDITPAGTTIGNGYSNILTARLATEKNSWDAPHNAAVKWHEVDEIWSGSGATPLAEDTVIGLDVEAKVLHVIGGHTFRTSGINTVMSVIERVGIVPEDMDTVTTVVKGYLHFRGDGEVVVEFGEQEYPNSPVRWRESKTVNVFTQRKIDFRSTGRLHAYRISGASNGNWKFGGMTLEYVYAGKR